MVTRLVVAKLDRIEAAAAALTDLVRAAPDPRRPVPATPAWSIAQVYAHVAAEVPRYEADALGTGARVADAGALAAENVRFVASIAPSSIDDVDRRLGDGLRALRSTFTGFGDDLPTVTLDGGAVMPADVALGALLGEFLVHGYDIARVCGRRWDFEPGDVGIVLEALNALAPHWVKPAAAARHTATYELSVGRKRHIYEFTEGELTVDPVRPRRIDVHIRLKAAAALPALYLRRRPLHMAARGDTIAWGRKPWLAPGFGRRFHAP